MTYNLAGTLDSLALTDETVRTEQHDTDLTGLEVHAHALDARGEPGKQGLDASFETCRRVGDSLDQLLSLDVGQAVDTGNTVTRSQMSAFSFSSSALSAILRCQRRERSADGGSCAANGDAN